MRTKKITLVICCFIICLIIGAINPNIPLNYATGILLMFLISSVGASIVGPKSSLKIISITFVTSFLLMVLILGLLNGMDKIRLTGLIYIFILLLSIFIGTRIVSAKTLTSRSLIFFSFVFIAAIVSRYVPILTQQYNLFSNIDGRSSQLIRNENLRLFDAKENHVVTLNEKDKIYVLDFWNNNCGICFTKFPIVDELRKKYIDSKNIEFLAVNVFRDTTEIPVGSKLHLKHNGNIKNLFMKDRDAKQVNINMFPTVIVIKNEQEIFRGTIEALSIFDSRYLK